jgi:hypothetical protein
MLCKMISVHGRVFVFAQDAGECGQPKVCIGEQSDDRVLDILKTATDQRLVCYCFLYSVTAKIRILLSGYF